MAITPALAAQPQMLASDISRHGRHVCLERNAACSVELSEEREA